MDAFLQLAGTAGLPTSFVGVLLFLFFYMRKQEAAVRVEQLATIARLRGEVVELDAAKDKAVAIAEKLRADVNEKDVEIARLVAKLYGLGSNGS